MRIKWNAPDGSIKVSVYVKNDLIWKFFDENEAWERFPKDVKAQIMGKIKERLKGTGIESLGWDELLSMVASEFVRSGGDIS